MNKIKPIITGAEFPVLPTEFLAGLTLEPFESINEVLYLSPKGRAEKVREARAAGYAAAIDLAKFFGRKIVNKKRVPRGNPRALVEWQTPLTTGKVFTYLKIYRKQSKKDPLRGDQTRDIYNVLVKGFIDGFTDAGVWIDDSENYHPDFWVHFEGFFPAPPKMEIYFYEI